MKKSLLNYKIDFINRNKKIQVKCRNNSFK